MVSSYLIQSSFQWGGVFHVGGNKEKNIKDIPPSPVAPLRVVLYLLMSFRFCDHYPNTRLGLWWCIHWLFLYLRCQDRREISFGRGLHSCFYALSWGGIFLLGVYITENIKNITPLQYPLMKHVTCIPSACLAFCSEVVANLLRYAPSVAVNPIPFIYLL